MEAAASTSGSGLRRPLPPRPWPRPRLPRPELPPLRLGQEVPHGRPPPSLSASVEPGRRAPPSPAVVSGRCRPSSCRSCYPPLLCTHDPASVASPPSSSPRRLRSTLARSIWPRPPPSGNTPFPSFRRRSSRPRPLQPHQRPRPCLPVLLLRDARATTTPVHRAVFVRTPRPDPSSTTTPC